MDCSVNSTYAFSIFSGEEKRKEKMMDDTSEHAQTESILCSEEWWDVVITFIPQLNDILIEDNYSDISLKEIKDAYFKYGKQKRPHQKRVK